MKTTYPKLPVKFKAKWLKALRSGEYDQGKSSLYDTENDKDFFCCLGVGCVVLGIDKEELIGEGYPHEGIESVPEYFCDNSDIKNENGDTWQEALSMRNDGVRYRRSFSFKQIANWIEKNL